jgi:hypothetical protein
MLPDGIVLDEGHDGPERISRVRVRRVNTHTRRSLLAASSTAARYKTGISLRQTDQQLSRTERTERTEGGGECDLETGRFWPEAAGDASVLQAGSRSQL